MNSDVEQDNYVYPGPRISKKGFSLGTGQGISLHNYFMGQALANPKICSAGYGPATTAAQARDYANAMMAIGEPLKEDE
jgi:hypothetical protein